MTRPKKLRRVIENPEFQAMFGEAKPMPPTPSKPKTIAKRKKQAGSSNEEEEDQKPTKTRTDQGVNRRRNVFGHEDELKNAPKGVARDHKDIDLLRLRTIAVVKHFTDDEVLASDFKKKIGHAVTTMEPLVSLLNEMLVPSPREEFDQSSSDGEEEGA